MQLQINMVSFVEERMEEQAGFKYKFIADRNVQKQLTKIGTLGYNACNKF